MNKKLEKRQRFKLKKRDKIKLIIGAQNAMPGSILNPILGQYGLNIKLFCDQFNLQTKNFLFDISINLVVFVEENKTFSFLIKGPLVLEMIWVCVKKERDGIKLLLEDFLAIVLIKKQFLKISFISLVVMLKNYLDKKQIQII